MKVVELIETLKASGCELKADADQLLVRDPQGALTPELRAAIVEHKAALVSQFSKREDLPDPSRWSRLADSGLNHNDVLDHAEVIFLFACELILDPSKAREDCPALPAVWAHYSPFWRERLPYEAFGELEARYRRRLADLGLQDKPLPLQGPKALRPLALNPEGTGCAECGSADYWVSGTGMRYCLACHPAFYKDVIAIGTVQAAEEETRRPSMRRRAGGGATR